MKTAYALIIAGGIFVADNILRLLFGQSMVLTLALGVALIIVGVICYNKCKKIERGEIQ
jgi:multidrug transporter EmrE-like cation transporter